jgi:hypothetical protein
MMQMHLHSLNRGRESASAYHAAGFTQMLSGSLRMIFVTDVNMVRFFQVLMFQGI